MGLRPLLQSPDDEREPARPALSADLAVAWTVAAAVAVVAVAGMEPSPYSPPLLAGDGPAPPLAALSHGLGLVGLSRSAADVLGIVVMGVAVLGFLYALREAWRGRLSIRVVVALALDFLERAT